MKSIRNIIGRVALTEKEYEDARQNSGQKEDTDESQVWVREETPEGVGTRFFGL